MKNKSSLTELNPVSTGVIIMDLCSEFSDTEFNVTLVLETKIREEM